MNEQEARKVFSHVFSMCNVLGGDIRQMCAQRGVPEHLITSLLREQESWDKRLGKFDWDGTVKRSQSTERRHEERVSVNIPATFFLENRLYPCIVQNMSTGGVLLKFHSKPDLLLSTDDTGKSGTVVLGDGEKSKKSLHGRIVRVLLNDNAPVAALSVVG